MKICNDCKHFSPHGRCVRLEEVATCPVYGEKYLKNDNISCHVERQENGSCGPEGKFWEGKE